MSHEQRNLKRSTPPTDASDMEPAAKRSKARSWATSKMVVVKLVSATGTERLFNIHKDVLCTESEYFRNQISELEKTGQGLEITPTGVRDDAFEYILDYLYDGAITKAVSTVKPDNLDDLIYAWLLAEKFAMESCKNSIMDVVQETVSAAVSSFGNDKILVRKALRTIQTLDLEVRKVSPLRRFFVERFARDLTFTDINLSLVPRELQEDVPALFVESGEIVAEAMGIHLMYKKGSVVKDPAATSDCAYHEHEKGTGDDCGRRKAAAVAAIALDTTGGGLFGRAIGDTSNTNTSAGFEYFTPSNKSSVNTGFGGGMFGSVKSDAVKASGFNFATVAPK